MEIVLEKPRCAMCDCVDCRIYRPYGEFFRASRLLCNDCMTEVQEGFYVPCIISDTGQVSGYYNTEVREERDVFRNLPEKNPNKPSPITSKTWK